MLTTLAAHATVLLAQSRLFAVDPTTPPASPGAGIPAAGCNNSIRPPDNIGAVFDKFLGWVKWGSLAILTIAFFAAVGMMVWGRMTYHPRGARVGFDVLVVCLVAAVVYVAGYSIIKQITGCG